MGCGWGYGNYRSDEQRESPVFFISGAISNSCSLFFRVFGGILGWDPVLTICIFCERSYRMFIKYDKNIVYCVLIRNFTCFQ